MLMPIVTENLSTRRRKLERVRRSRVAVPEPLRAAGRADPRDSLHRIAPRRRADQQDDAW